MNEVLDFKDNLCQYHACMGTTDDEEIIKRVEKAQSSTPEFFISPDVNSFWNMNVDNAYVTNYVHLGKIDFGDIAI